MLLVECKTDRALAVSLVSVPLKKIEHAGNKTGVLKKLTQNYKNSIGVIDEDPLSIQPPDLRKFVETERLDRVKVRMMHHRRLNNCLLILCPRLEEWTLEAAREAQIDMRDYGLPSDPRALHEVVNIRIDRFQDLVSDLQGKSARVTELRRLLRQSMRKRATRHR